jgi:osmotically-inducible protein OsmY
MANQQQGNGRNETTPVQNRPTWRTDTGDDRDDERDDRQRSTEYYGQGQSGYGAGRYEDDRAYGSRNQERFSGERGGGAWRPEDRSMAPHHPGGGGYGQGREGYGNQSNYGSSGNMGAVAGSGGRYGDQGNYRQSYDRSDEGGYLGQSGQQMGYGSPGYRGGGHEQPGAQQRGAMPSPGHRGKGPSGYTRSDDRIREHVCEALMEDDHVDATHIEVTVKNGEVTLSGTVEDRRQKRMAEDCIEHLSGVIDVVNQLRIGSSSRENGHTETASAPSSSSSDKRHRA